MNHGQRARRHNQAAIRGARECRDGALDLAGSRTLTGLTCTPTDGATDWITANWPIPETIAGSRRTAARVTPARPGQAINKTRADRIGDVYEHDWHGARRTEESLPADRRKLRDALAAVRKFDGMIGPIVINP
jgi:hypothetical protein